MGLTERKTSDRLIGGSTLTITGQPIYTVKKFPNSFSFKNNKPLGGTDPPVTTTTTTQLILTCYIQTQDFDNITTQDNFNLIWC